MPLRTSRVIEARNARAALTMTLNCKTHMVIRVRRLTQRAPVRNGEHTTCPHHRRAHRTLRRGRMRQRSRVVDARTSHPTRSTRSNAHSSVSSPLVARRGPSMILRTTATTAALAVIAHEADHPNISLARASAGMKMGQCVLHCLQNVGGAISPPRGLRVKIEFSLLDVRKIGL